MVYTSKKPCRISRVRSFHILLANKRLNDLLRINLVSGERWEKPVEENQTSKPLFKP